MYEKLNKVIDAMSIPAREYIFIDDGSTDNTIEVIKDIAKVDKNVKLIRISQRVGHQIACFAGIMEAKGDIVVSLDSDLQHPPEVIPQLYQKWQQGFDIVNTIRTDTYKKSAIAKILSALFYKFIKGVSSLKIKASTADFRLIDRKVVQELSHYSDRDLFLRGVISDLHYATAFIEYIAPARIHGSSKYHLKQRISFAFIGIFYFSEIPLRLSTYASVLAFFVTIGFGVYELIAYLNGNPSPPGYITQVMLVNIYSGIILFVLGIIGIYISKIYHQTKAKPVYYIAEKINF